MSRAAFRCIDGHTAGNPVRLVYEGAPDLNGESMSARRRDFMARFDWIRTGLCFEPRGHDMMSGGFLYPSSAPEADIGILFIETSGCLPMCGHGTIGIVTFGIENGLIKPRTPGRFVAEAPAGLIQLTYVQDGERVHAGDPLMDGPRNPHDILHVLGEQELQKYIVNEVQEVYGFRA